MTQAPLDVFMAASSFPGTRADWKSVFIRHLAEALARRPDVSLGLWAPPGESTPEIRWLTRPDDRALLAGIMERGGLAHLGRNRPHAGVLLAARMLRALRKAAAASSAQVYHVNWLQNALSLPGDGRPLLVSVLGSDLALLRLPLMRPLLKRAFRGRRTMLCPNAEWMVPALQSAFGSVAEVRFLPLAVDEAWYEVARLELEGPPRWAVVSRLTRDKLGDLFEWCAPHFEDARRELHLFGPMQEQIALPGWVHYHGATDPDHLRTHVFPGATGLITLSRHAEGRPQAMLEAMAAGVPIIASDLAAHASFIRHGETGLLCGSPEQLRDGLLQLEDPRRNAAIAAGARAWVKNNVGNWHDCAGRYVGAYHELLEDRV